MEGETGVILDSTKPLCFICTEDIRASYDHLQELGVEILTDVEDISSVYTLVFKDPNGNELMVCQRTSQ